MEAHRLSGQQQWDEGHFRVKKRKLDGEIEIDVSEVLAFFNITKDN